MKSLFFLISFIGVEVMAQVVPVVSPSPLVAVVPVVPVVVQGQWLLDLAKSHPWLLSILVVVGGLRLVLKPLFAGLHKFFQDAGLVAWDQKELAIEQSKPVQVLFFILDYLGSVKVPVKEDKA